MSQNDDSSFFRTFVFVLGALVLFTVFIAVMANMFSPASDRASDPLVQREQAQQIAPVGKSRVDQSSAAAPAADVQPAVTATATDESAITETTTAETTTAETTEATAQTEDSDATEPAATEEAPVAETTETGNAEATTETAQVTTSAVASTVSSDIPLRVKAVVATNCAGCHQDGLYGAQRSDDAAAWRALEAKGLETLTASVINGQGAMLPRAETSLNDEEISQAVSYMIQQATGNSTDAAATQSDTETAQAVESASTGEATAETTETTATEETQQETAETTATTETATAETATAVAAAPTGEVPANVKTVVDTLCAGCHISGVANAPKYGDKAAWDERLSMGMDKLLASAIAGKGAMPARGGSQLSDAELRLAIEYMATK